MSLSTAPPLVFRLFSCLLAGLIITAVSHAQSNIQWSNVDGGTFSTGTNWTGGTAPGAADSALFDLVGEDFEVDFTASVSNDRLLVYNGDVTFDLDGSTYTLTNTATGHTAQSAFVVGVSNGNTGSLTVLSGTVEARQMKVGLVPGSTGTLVVGAGGLVRTVTINDNSAHDFLAGNNGSTGVVIVEDGGSIVTNSRVFIGRNQSGTGGGDGSLIVRGTGSLFSAGRETSIANGNGVSGSVRVESGGEFSLAADNRDLSVATASDSDGTITVTGLESLLSVQRDVFLGNTGGASEANLNIFAGGLVSIDRHLEARQGSVISGDATLRVGNTFTLAGSISPGNPTVPAAAIGTLTVEGGLVTTSTAEFIFKIGGASPGLYDVLLVENAVTLDGGSLDISMVNDFELGFHQMFHVLQAESGLTGILTGLDEGALVGTFNGVNLYVTYEPDILFMTADGGIALYSIPEPAWVGSILAAAALFLAVFTRRRKGTVVARLSGKARQPAGSACGS